MEGAERKTFLLGRWLFSQLLKKGRGGGNREPHSPVNAKPRSYPSLEK